MTPSATCPSIQRERETFDAEQHESASSPARHDLSSPPDDTSLALTPVMRDSILTARRRQHERLAALVRRAALDLPDDQVAELERTIRLVQAGELSARDAHEIIAAAQRDQRRAA